MAIVQMKFLGGLLFAMCLLVPFISAESIDVHYCNKKTNYAVKVSGLNINPYPLSRNKNTSFEIVASTNEAISGGKLVIDVSYFFLHVRTENYDLCKKTACPVTVGDFVVHHSQELPGITPPGSYTLKMTMEDGNKKQLTCINFDFSIGFLAEENLADI